MEYITVREACERLFVAARTLYRWVAAKLVRVEGGRRKTRVCVADVLAILNRPAWRLEGEHHE